ncbi:MAG: DUF4097 family beta strand repeat-containing protein [Acidobacteria bacterium]|nr:DUF4097 family beta strand repeat-containing protein [Acidobacteriota bacterium]
MLKKRWTLFVLVLAVASLAAGDGFAQTRPELTEEFHQSYPLAAGGRVSLSNLNGKVRVTAWDRNEVRVDAVKRAYKPERLREAEIKINAGADHIDIETEYPKREREYRSGDKWEREDNPATVEYTLSVPRGARLDEINLVNGALEIEGVGGTVNASSVNGRVTARGLTGAVELSVVNGRLEASFDHLNESSSVSLSSVNGALTLVIPSDSNALLKADTVHGSISNDFNLPVRRGEYVGRDLEGRLGAGTTRVKLSNVNGAITIRRANDSRPLSPSTNLLSETPRRDADEDSDVDSDRQAVREAASEVVVRAEFDKSFAQDYVERAGRVVSFNSGASVEFDVYVPRNSTLFVSSGDGRLRVEGVSGELDLRTGDGSIDVAESRGRLVAQTGDGRIRLDNFDGEASARTGDGRITLDGRFSKLAARTGDGTISLSIPEGANATLETDAESVANDGVAVAVDGGVDGADKRVRRWRIGGGGELYTLHTGGGQVILRRR